MAHGSNSNLHYYFCKFANTKKEDGYGYIELVDSDTKVEEEVDYISGDLRKIEFGTTKDEKYETVTITLVDGTDAYRLGLFWNQYTRSILNKLLTIQGPQKIQFSFFGREGEWKNVSVKQFGEVLDYKFDIELANSMVQHVEFKGKKQSDWSEFEKFLRENIENDIIPLLGHKHPASEDTRNEESIPEEKEETTDPLITDANLEDDLPF